MAVSIGELEGERVMRRRWFCFMLLCFLTLGVNADRIPGLQYDRSVSAAAREHGTKADLQAYLARVFGKKLSIEKGCASISVPSDCLFRPRSDEVRATNWATSIDTVAAICNRYPQTNIIVSAYTDCRHSEERNLALSELQAWMIKQALVDKGIAARKIRARGWGESRPIASNATQKGRKANRRIMISFGPACADGH